MKKKIILIIVIIGLMILLFPNIKSYANQYREKTNLNDFDKTRYPGYIEKIKELKANHPNWNFEFFYTGLDWNTVVYNETTGYHGRSLIQNKSGEWLCSMCGNKVYDGYNWYCASVKALSYYLDPRNFLSTEQLFQFEKLSYIDNGYTEEGVETILKGTFMYKKSISEYYENTDYTSSTFAQIIMEAAKEAGISPYHIAARMKQEIIVSGGTPSNSVTGKVPEYESLYNFFNIGATSGQGAVERGLKYAKEKEWNTPDKSIKEGTKIISNSYINRGQNTLYLEKFDVDSSDNTVYSHQYQQNIQAPLNESIRVYKAYLELEMTNKSFDFVIPVYENMPSIVSELPKDDFFIVTEDVEVNSDNIEIKLNDYTDAELITIVNKGTKLLRIEKSSIWDKVVLDNGTKGYIQSKYLNIITNTYNLDEKMYVKDNVNLRNGPGIIGTNIINKLNAGTQITRIEAQKYNLDGYTWDRIKLNDGTQGYVASSFIEKIEQKLEGETVKVIAKGSLKLREQPTTDSAIITSLPTTTLLTRIEKNVGNANGIIWDKVKTINGIEGYVASSYIESVSIISQNPEVEPENDDIDSSDFFTVDKTKKIIKCLPSATIKDLKSVYNNIILKDKNGKEIKEENNLLATGMKLTINKLNYEIVKYGDINGDSIIDPEDANIILKYVVGDYNLEHEAYFIAADINKDNVVDSRDALRILKFSVDEFEIVL